MIHSWGDHIGKRTAWSLIYFLIYAYLNILACRKFSLSVSINRPHLNRLPSIKPCNIFCTVQVIFFNCVANCFNNTGYECFYCASSNANPKCGIFFTLLGLGLIKINIVSANSNNPRPSIILNE